MILAGPKPPRTSVGAIILPQAPATESEAERASRIAKDAAWIAKVLDLAGPGASLVGVFVP